MKYMTKNAKITIPLLVAMLLIPMEILPEVFAWHDLDQPVMTPSDRDWNCRNYDGIDVRNNVSFCSEVKKADDTWNGVSDSDFHLGYTTVPITDIHVKGEDPPDDGNLARSYQALYNGVLVGGDIKWDTDTFCFTDSSKRGADASCYDIQSVAAHEFGHMQWVGHSYFNWDSIMQDNLAPNTERHNVEQHDIDVLRARH